mmetsp:Transcript_72598/g.234926  ORF Transcript_72598/g.234926 Transcript_72598/m.234926 type:complete len:355 (-) Transcript_72598:183-1247(-)
MQLAVRVEGDGRWPVREDALDADIVEEHVEHLVDVAVVVGDAVGRPEVPAATGLQRARALQGPGDDLQSGSLGCNGILRGLILATLRLQEHLHGGRDVLDALVDVRGEVVILRASCEGAVAVLSIQVHGLRAEGRGVVGNPVVDVGQVEGLGPDLVSRNAGVDVLLDELGADLVVGDGQAPLGEGLQLGRELGTTVLDEVDGLCVAHKSAAGGIEVRAPGSGPLEVLRGGRGLAVGGVHLSAEALELRQSEVRGATIGARICASGAVVGCEGRGALRCQGCVEDVRGGVQVALRVPADKLAILRHSHVALHDAGPLDRGGPVGLRRVLGELHASTTMTDGLVTRTHLQHVVCQA